MREEIRWIAEDGTIFDDECECREYEWKESTASATFTLLSDGFRILPVDETKSYEDCWYIYLPTEKSVRQIVQCWDTDLIGAYLPDPFINVWDVDTGLWAYDTDDDSWYHLGNRLAGLQSIANSCMDAINGA
jgi:hypothetical protein